MCKAGGTSTLVARNLKGKTGKIRTAEFRGAKYMVVPVVALVEGVVRPANSPGPELVLASEFGHQPAGWNGRPVMMNHPQVDGEFVSASAPEVLESAGIGQMFKSAMQDKELHTEAWIERDRAVALGGDAARLVERLDAGEAVEVSVGVLLDIESKSGTHGGQDYEGVWRNVVPDHLAMLKEGDTGACSIHMGCGAQRANQGGPLRKFMARVASALQLDAVERAEYEALLTGARSIGLFRDLITDVDLRSALEIVLRDAEPGFLGILAVDDAKTVVYHSFADGGGGVRMYARSFKKRDSKITLSEDKQEVRTETAFISVNSGTPLKAACGCGRQPAASAATTGGTGMKTKAEMIAALIASPKNAFLASDQTYLESLTDDRVKGLFDHEATLQVATTPATPAPAPAPATPAVAAAAPAAAAMTEADALRMFPSIAAAVNAHTAAQTKRKTELVTALKASQKVYSEEQLNAMPVERLEEVHALVAATQPAADYSALGIASAAPVAGAELPDAWGLKAKPAAATH